VAAEPEKYIQRVWGERQVGGTSVLYVSDVDLNLTDLATSISDETPMPERTFKILHHMPAVFVEMAAVMGGIYWVIERREKLAHEKAAGTGADGEASSGLQEGAIDAPDSEGDDERNGS